jgi:MFS family permease
MNSSKQPAGFTGFIVIWLGQIVSILASGMSGFALTLWMYQKTESATAMSFMQVAYILPFLLMSIPAGIMVDKYNRKLMMMVSDLTAVLATFGLLILSATGRLEFWHLYLSSILYGIGNTFQWPAYSAAISTMIPKEQLGRANGLMSLMEAGPGIVAPLLAGMLFPVIGLTGILLIDAATFFFAIGALSLVHVPQPERTLDGETAEEGNLLQKAAFGFKYIFARPSLLGLQMVFFFANLFSGIAITVFAPMILARTNQDSTMFGIVQTAGAIGGIIGGVAMSAWGGFKRRVNGVLAGWMYSGLVATALLGLNGLPFWLAGMLLGSLAIPVVNGSNQAIWQSKVAPDIQGRVFSARRLIAWFTQPIAPIIGGLLADFVLEPAMRTQSALAVTFGWLVGTGPGAGMGLLMVFCGLLVVLIGLAGYFIPVIRDAEDLLPDHDQIPRAAQNAA